MNVTIIEDSISPEGVRLTTLHARYWRPIHAELMTHRVFGRNARSSRAVPSVTLLSEDIFVPKFGMNQSGMQSEIQAPRELQEKWAREWTKLASITRDQVRRWSEEKMHKQHANRPLEWFGWIDVLVTATQWNNFFALRISEYAQPEFDELAREILKRMNKSKPKILLSGEWHLPYITNDERKNLSLEDCQKVSVARCARLSYKPFDGNADYGAEMERYRRLMVAQPVHASPAEHQATPDIKIGMGSEKGKWWYPELHGNLHGWIQYRKTIPGEAVDG
jgi:hypothetical protein